MRIPLGTEIFPCTSADRGLGAVRKTTVEVTFESVEIIDRFTADDPSGGPSVEFICLALPENPSPYDCYAVRLSSVEEKDRS